jgi:hypothetical protein
MLPCLQARPFGLIAGEVTSGLQTLGPLVRVTYAIRDIVELVCNLFEMQAVLALLHVVTKST